MTASSLESFLSVGQESSNNTNSWGLVHDNLDKLYTRLLKSGSFKDVRSSMEWKTTIGAFVDDVTLLDDKIETTNKVFSLRFLTGDVHKQTHMALRAMICETLNIFLAYINT